MAGAPGSWGRETVWDRPGGCWWVAARRVPAGPGPRLREIVGRAPEGADDRIRGRGGRVGGRDPLGPAEPVPPVTGGGVARGDDVTALRAVVRVLHEQGRQSPRRRGDVGAPATGVHLRRQHVQACDVGHAYLPPDGPSPPEWAFVGSTRPAGGWMGWDRGFSVRGCPRRPGSRRVRLTPRAGAIWRCLRGCSGPARPGGRSGPGSRPGRPLRAGGLGARRPPRGPPWPRPATPGRRRPRPAGGRSRPRRRGSGPGRRGGGPRPGPGCGPAGTASRAARPGAGRTGPGAATGGRTRPG